MLSGRNSPHISAPVAAEASFLFMCLHPLGMCSVGCPSSAFWLLTCLCPGFSQEQISRAGDNRSHEKTVADVSLLSNTLWILNLLGFSGGRWLSVCVVVCYLSHIGYTQHRSGVLFMKVAKVHLGDIFWSYKRTRKWDGSVGAMKTAPCYRPYRPCKRFRIMF